MEMSDPEPMRDHLADLEDTAYAAVGPADPESLGGLVAGAEELRQQDDDEAYAAGNAAAMEEPEPLQEAKLPATWGALDRADSSAGVLQAGEVPAASMVLGQWQDSQDPMADGQARMGATFSRSVGPTDLRTGAAGLSAGATQAQEPGQQDRDAAYPAEYSVGVETGPTQPRLPDTWGQPEEAGDTGALQQADHFAGESPVPSQLEHGPAGGDPMRDDPSGVRGTSFSGGLGGTGPQAQSGMAPGSAQEELRQPDHDMSYPAGNAMATAASETLHAPEPKLPPAWEQPDGPDGTSGVQQAAPAENTAFSQWRDGTAASHPPLEDDHVGTGSNLGGGAGDTGGQHQPSMARVNTYQELNQPEHGFVDPAGDAMDAVAGEPAADAREVPGIVRTEGQMPAWEHPEEAEGTAGERQLDKGAAETAVLGQWEDGSVGRGAAMPSSYPVVAEESVLADDEASQGGSQGTLASKWSQVRMDIR